MGLKYRDPETGEYIKYNIPILKGEKGDKGEPGAGGIHVGVEAPTDPNINLWFNQMTVLTMCMTVLTPFLMTEYFWITLKVARKLSD